MTPLQNACLIAIRDLTVDGVAPSYSELQRRLGLSSRSAVFSLVEALERQGYIRRDRKRHRGLTIIEREGGAVSEDRLALMSDDALQSLLVRVSAALSHRRTLSGLMREGAA